MGGNRRNESQVGLHQMLAMVPEEKHFCFVATDGGTQSTWAEVKAPFWECFASDGLTAKGILVISLVLTRGYERDDDFVTCLVSWKCAVKGDITSLSTKRS